MYSRSAPRIELPARYGRLVPNEEVTGYSGKLSFDEALGEAINKIPPSHMLKFSVTDIGVEVGGVGGVRRMFVTVRRVE